MTSEKDWLDYLGECAGEACADYDRALADSAEAEVTTPVFDATVASLATPEPADSAVAVTAADEVEDEQAWVDVRYGAGPPSPTSIRRHAKARRSCACST
jgi:hypothetical protein